MASRGDINYAKVQPNLFSNWKTIDFEKSLDKTPKYVKHKTKGLSNNGIYPVIDQGDSFIGGYIDDLNKIYTGELPIIVFGDHTRIVKFINFKFAVGADGTKILRPKNQLNPKFFFYYLKTLNIPDLGYSRHFKILKEVKVPIPPRAEQDRIVAKLDGLFEQLEGINKSLDHIPTLLKNFRQQVLTQAVTGKLTEEWREGKELEEWIPKKKNQNYRPWKISLPNDWNVYSFETIAEIQANLKNPDQYPDHILVAPNHIEKYTGRLIETQLTKDIAPKSDKHYFVKGSIVYSKIRPYLSKLIIAEFDGLCSADMYPIKANIEQRFLFYYMLSQIFLQYVTTAGERSVLPKVNQKGLNNIPVPVPPLKEQQEIVKRVESLFAKADKLEEHFNALKTKMDQLPQAILNKAFKGELVAQFDSDGDAKELLKEIKELKGDLKSKKS